MEAFKFIKDVYEQSGLLGVLSVALLGTVITVILLVGKDFFKGLFKKIKNYFMGSSADRKLKDHDLFKYLDVIINHQIHILDIKCPLRNKIFKKILEVKLINLKDTMGELADYIEGGKDEELKSMFVTAFIQHNHSWIKLCKEQNIPEPAILKFNDFYSSYSKPLETIIQDLTSSDIMVKDGAANTHIIFNIVKSMVVASILAAEKTLNYLNGELTNVEYNGQRCQKCPGECKFAKHV